MVELTGRLTAKDIEDIKHSLDDYAKGRFKSGSIHDLLKDLGK